MRCSAAEGRKVVDIATAATVGQVSDYLIDASDRSIAGLTLKKTDGKADTLPWAGVHAFGEEAIMVAEAGAIVTATGRLAELGDKRARVRGKRVLSSDGVDMGTCKDVEFDPATGEVTGLVVADQTIEGQRLLAAGSYAVIVRA